MRRAIVTGTATVSGVVLLLGLKPHEDTPSAAQKSLSITSDQQANQGSSNQGSSSQGSTNQGSTNQGSTNQGSTTPSTAPPSSSPAKSSSTKTVTGDAADTRYGPVQVAVTFTGKKITKIDVVEYPTESGRDREINSYAIPQLNQEAMAAQSANIDGVSGATYTAEGYVQSLQSAIDKAGA
ncbi:FMN-binding protein [Catenulispora subtropica]|uniref:FMN-binding domain-containing protein n=1 Tax=Catenulispora subtropica TaxID=450798 RepID=A0ABN2RUR3_9ACTN